MGIKVTDAARKDATKKIVPQASRSNRDIVKEINVSADAEGGARPQARKDSTNSEDSRRVGKLPPVQQVRTAVVVEGAAKKARESQIIGNSIPQFPRTSQLNETL
jgi:hypothetical protein